MSKTTLVMQQVQLQEWFHMMQESKDDTQRYGRCSGNPGGAG